MITCSAADTGSLFPYREPAMTLIVPEMYGYNNCSKIMAEHTTSKFSLESH